MKGIKNNQFNAVFMILQIQIILTNKYFKDKTCKVNYLLLKPENFVSKSFFRNQIFNDNMF